MSRKYVLLFSVFLVHHLTILAQEIKRGVYPVVGKPCPDVILRNIRYYPLKQATLKSFRGKWLVLDFWNKYCGACIASFPKVSALQEEFGDKVQIMMVGIQDPEKAIEPMFAKYRARQNLVMPCAFDSLLANRWNIYTAPHIVIIDDKGIVRGITQSLSAEQIEIFLKGGKPDLLPIYGHDSNDIIDQRVLFNAGLPFLVNGNGGVDGDFIFRSLLSKFSLSKQQQFAPQNIKDSVKEGKFQVIGVPLHWLYNYAYFGVARPGGYWGDSTFGKYQNTPILEIKDSSFFRYSFSHDKNLFAYSLTMPSARSSVESLQRSLQDELRNCFGYQASIEVRKCPCWKWVRVGVKAKPNLIGDNKDINSENNKSKTFAFGNLLSNTFYKFQDQIFVDETGISDNVDITVEDGLWITIEDAQKSLQHSGLALVAGETNMNVIVIRDANPTINTN